MKKTFTLTLLFAFVLSFGVFAALPAHAGECCDKAAKSGCCDKAAKSGCCDKAGAADKGACDKSKSGEKGACTKEGKCTKPADPAPAPSK